ncbi:hypothetical protein CBO05C_0329 [Clostridium botulinum B str. Osaka05]|uniref:Uncharacterized protein n=1 Tax=Clostridium botulinum B str. Osaka05 TaxID=1407017 RepID=A0A0S6U0M6_CLOBO|nr:hypothetical protein [Clostridium botulinum]GAE00639.1 hypothetical protein CBO05C_0329 [Clostridium botulinum B str. Osaka05]
MKNLMKKGVPLFLILLLFTTFIGTNKVKAYYNGYNIQWNFKINLVGDAKRVYDYDGRILTYNMEKFERAKFSGETYNINTKEVAIQTNLTNHYNNIYIQVDGKFVGKSNDILLGFEHKGKEYYTTFPIKYLTPGKHHIEVISDPPYNDFSGERKKDYCYVNVPVFEDEKILSSIEKINKGDATLDDYEIVGVNPLTISDDELLNNRIKGKNVNAANVQETANKIISEIKEEKRLEQAFKKINEGIGDTNDYKIIGIENITSSNLKELNVAIKFARQAKQSDLTKNEIELIMKNLPQQIEKSFEAVNAGTATLDDYQLIGITGITEVNLVDVNEALKGKEFKVVSKVQSAANIITDSLKSINSGVPYISYYEKLGITTVNSDNIKATAKAVKEARDAKKVDLTKTEINKIVNEVLEKIEKSFEAVNAGTATLADYELIGVTGVTEINLVDVNEALKGKGHTIVSKVQSEANVIINSLDSINKGYTSTSYYERLGITTVKSDNVKVIAKAVKEARDAKKVNLTKAEINKIVNEVLDKIKKSFDSVNAGTSTLADYELIGVTGVTEINLVDVNEVLKGKGYTIVSKVQSEGNVIINSLDSINKGYTSTSYYEKLGITTVKSDNIKAIAKAVKEARDAKKVNLTKAEINKIVNEVLDKIKKSFDSVNAGTSTLADYELIGVTGVTEINLVDVNEVLKGKGYTIVSKVQSEANVIINSLDSINKGYTSTSYYERLGITTVKSDNIKAIVKAVKEARDAKKVNLTKAEINKIVNEVLDKIKKSFGAVNAGTATLADYELIGITGVTEINLVDVNEALKGKGHKVVSKVQSEANIIINSLDSINKGYTSTSYYERLGITTVKSDNIKAIAKAVKEARDAKKVNLTKAEINKIVNEVLDKIKKSFGAVNAGTATLADYELIGVTGVTEINLVDVNESLKGKGHIIVSKVQSEANVIINSLDSINKGYTSTSYYEKLGITTVKSDNIKAIAKAVKEARDAKKVNLTKAEINKIVNEVLNKK